MAGWELPSDDLVLSRLLDETPSKSLKIATTPEMSGHLLAVRPAPDPRSIRFALRRADSRAVESLQAAIPEYSPLIEGGAAAVFDLHAIPDREVAFENQVLLLRAREAHGETAVQSAIWLVERSANRTVIDGGPLTIDEFSAPRDLGRLEGLLMEWAQNGHFVPEMATLRVVAVVTPAFASDKEGLDRALRAIAAVHGATLDVFTSAHDPRDTKRAERFERRLSGGGYHVMITLSNPDEGWVWKMATRLKKLGLEFHPVFANSAPDAAAELGSILSVVAGSWPKRPARFWDAASVKRVELLVCESFAITQRARSHLQRNRYPDPERMLDHVEKLAQCARAWNDLMHLDDLTAERFEEWAFREFALTIALHDKGIDAKRSIIEFDGLDFDNRPHVKVDDGVAPSECGRIYFAIDDRRDEGIRRLIVDHVGLHDRS